MKKIIITIIFLAMVINTAFVSIGRAAIINAASCSNQNIQSAINAAASGDQINVPSGNCTWTSTVTIPAGKTIYLIGAGSGQTIIQRNTTMLASYSDNSRISGFRFNQLTGGSPSYIVEIRGKGWRIDHNIFDDKAYTSGYHEGVYANGANTTQNPEGLIDNNVFTECKILAYGNLANMNAEWAKPHRFGDEHSVYIENNTITRTQISVSVDSNAGGHYVFRYNTINDTNVMAHSLQGSAERGTRAWEIYNNKWTYTTTDWGNIAFLRGGTGMVYSNYVTGPLGSEYRIDLDNVRGFQSGCCGTNQSPNAGMCDGTSLWDGNTPGKSGWPCRDQIGRGQDTGTDSSIIGKATSSQPAYFWTNKRSTRANVAASVTNGTENWIQANRDYYDYNASFNGTSGTGCGTLAARPATCTSGVGYWATNQSCSDLTGMVGANPSTPSAGTLYKCTATNTWTAYYTPYTYPHPLSGGGSEPPLSTPVNPPLNLQIVN